MYDREGLPSGRLRLRAGSNVIKVPARCGDLVDGRPESLIPEAVMRFLALPDVNHPDPPVHFGLGVDQQSVRRIAVRVDLVADRLHPVAVDTCRQCCDGNDCHCYLRMLADRGAQPTASSVGGVSTQVTTLDDPVGASLAGPHAGFAVRQGRVARYAPDVAPFASLGGPTDLDGLAAFADVGAGVLLLDP